jgi:AraC family transcriptional regulator
VCDRLRIFSAERPVPLGVTPSMSQMIGSNFISRMRADSVEFEEHDGPLSIKCAFRGKELYYTDGGAAQVDGSSYFVLNHNQRYASVIESESEVESFCFWFRPNFAEQVLVSLAEHPDHLLDDPNARTHGPVSFFDRVYRHDNIVSPMLFQIRAIVQTDHASAAWLEEQFQFLIERLLQAQRNVYREVEMLPAVRASTRAELYRRLYRARDFIEANLETPLSLNAVAEVAFLSSHHFLRTFQQVFGETPRQYQIRRRMEKVRVLLRYTEVSVTQICFDLGFESLGSFSWLFRKLHGVSPSQYRLDQLGLRAEKSTHEEAARASIH